MLRSLSLALLLLPSVVLADDPRTGHTAADAERLFALKVYPLLQTKCFGCHGNDPDDLKGAIDLTSLEATLQGGESEEPGLVVGHAEDSILYQAVMWDGYEMPPKENDRLTPAQTEWVRMWIDAGAPWPSDSRRSELLAEERQLAETEDGRLVPTSGGLSDEWTYRRYRPEDVWAFQPVTQPAVPTVSGTQPANPIDAFVRARLDEADAQPAPQAEPGLLIRRVTFDLLGLPPTPEEVDTFLAEWDRDSEQAWADLVDRLLASPHYGERQAQHWLDVTRYADTGGLSNDYERSNAWRYRDWVVRAFNDDLPYDDFIRAQLAGDEYAASDETEGTAAADPIATGFLRMGPWDTAMIPKEEARQLFLDDVTHSVGQTFLSMPLRCCKCHDHKFDPIPTRDYYRIYATFAGSQPAELEHAFEDSENLAGLAKQKVHVERMLAFADAEAKRLQKKREDAARAWYAERGREYKNYNDRKDDPDDQKPARHVGLTTEEGGILKVREQDVWIWTRRLERFEPMIQSVYNGQASPYTNARKLRKWAGKGSDKWMPESHIFGGGAYTAKLDEVRPGVLSGTGLPAPVAADDTDDPYRITDALDGRRTALAEWIADGSNPLTARSLVNRLWQSHFGRGLVGTPNNFGVKGDKPTHPELLDWLASDFVAEGWGIKRMHRQMVMSETYRQAAYHPDAGQLAEADPDNDLLAFFPPRRLSAEEIRDALLAATGELNPTLGGLFAKPEINMEVALQPRMIQFSLAPAYQPSPTPAERNRRSLYAYRVRGQADPMMEVFNLPNPNDSRETRDAAAVTPQAFTLLNSDLAEDRAIALARRLLDERPGGDVSQHVSRAIELVLSREATDREVDSLVGYVADMRAYHQRAEPEPVHYPTQITRSLVEELSGEPFEYEEILPVFEAYEPDAKPADVDAITRALADACLVLFNTNEFMYVY